MTVDKVLLDTEHSPPPSRTLQVLSPRWMGPFKVLAQVPNTYRLEIPVTWRACDEFNVKRLRPYHRCHLEPWVTAI